LSVTDKIQQAVYRNPSAPAFIYNGRLLTYRKFYSLLCSAARILHERGIGPGDIVGLSLEQTPLHCALMLALARLGAISVPVHPLLPQAAKARIAAKYGVRTVIARKDDPCRIDGVDFIRADTLTSGMGETDMDFTDYKPDAGTPFRISLSSGTTGEPKGVLFSHGYLLDRVENTLYECDRDSRVISFDLNFALGFVFSIGTLLAGGTVVIPLSYRPEEMIAAINLHAVTHVMLPPAMLMRMTDLLPDGGGIAFPTLKHLRTVGGAVPEMLLDALRAKWTSRVFVPYGLTEIGLISIATPEILAAHPDSTGRIRPGVQVETLDEEGLPLPPGVTGEIRVRRESMPAGYYGDEELSRQKFRDGWFYTGDLGRISEEGLLFIEGRADDMINLGGHKLDPNYIEKVLARHPDVGEAAVFLLENDGGRKFLAAAVIPRAESIRQDDLDAYARQELGMFFPKRFFVMQDFPRTLNGKVLRGKIPAMVSTMSTVNG
jgi:acyl-coenzyme A synthetase/AMP-(fatty) acid ligase